MGLAASAQVQIEREMKDELSQLKIRLANKHLFQVQPVEESVNAPFRVLEVEKLTPTADLDLNLTPSFLLLLEPKEKGSWLSVGPSIQKLS